MVTRSLVGILACVSCLFFFPVVGLTQSVRVTNVHFRSIEDRIEVFYDLPKNSDSIQVKLVFRKKSSPTFKYYPKAVSGDIGIDIFSGPAKKIVWDIKKEPASIFTGSNFYFKIIALKIPKKEDLIQQ
jgi:hypothetical protein